MNLDEGLGEMTRQPASLARARHGVPVVAHPGRWLSVKRKASSALLWPWHLDGDEARAAIRMIEFALGKEPPFVRALPLGCGH